MITNTGDKENSICQDGGDASDVPTLWKDEETISVSTKMMKMIKKKPSGFNLRKSLAWNPAFFAEQGVLDNLELSVLTGSHVNAIGSPRYGIGSEMSPLHSFGKSSNRSVLKQITENSRGKMFPKFQRTENKGRKLFPRAETSARDERKKLVVPGALSKSSARSTLKSIPRPPAGYTQKKVPNPSANAQMSKTPKSTAKKSQASLPPVPRNTSSVTNISKPNKNTSPVKAENTHTVEGLPQKSWVEPSFSAKSSGLAIQKDLEPPVTILHEEANISGSCRAFSPYPQSSPSSSVGVPASAFAKPSALRMPSPSVGFFTQGKAPASHGHTTQRNVERSFTGNPSSLIKPPRYKQPDNLKSRFRLPKQQPTDCSVISKLHGQPLTSESTLCTRTSSFPFVKHANPSNAKESLSKDIITNSARSGNANCEEMLEADCLSVRSRDNVQPPSSEKINGGSHGTLDMYDDASDAEGRSIFKDDELIEGSCSLKAICSSTKPTAGSKLSSSCMSSQECTHAGLCHQRNSEDGATAAINLKNSLVREKMIANSLSEGNNCTPGPDFMLDLGSCHHRNTERSTHMESVESITCADQEPLGATLDDFKSDLANRKPELHDSLDEEVQPASSEEPNTAGRMEPGTKNSLVVKEAFILHLGYNHGHIIAECSTSMEAEAPIMSSDLDAQCAVLSGLQTATADHKSELHESLAEENQPILSEEPNTKTKMVFDFDTNSLPVQEGASHIENHKEMDKPIANTIPQDHLKHLVPFTEEWFAIMETCGEDILELKTGTVQNSPTDKTTPEASPWSPVKRKAQDVGPFDCTKYSKSNRTSETP